MEKKTKGFKYKIPNPNEILVLNKMVTPSGKVVEINKKSTVKKYKDGGEVPAKFKGFSKLPEEVQMKMNPQAAKKYKKGGAVMKGRGGSYKGCK